MPLKKAITPLLIALVLSTAALIRTDGFSVGKVQGELAPGSAGVPSKEIQEALCQRYRYLAKGRQCFVFASEDGKKVIKFLNYNRFYFPDSLFGCPLPAMLCKMGEKRRGRFQKTVESLTLAAEKLAPETGIEYLHLQEGGSLLAMELVGPAGSRRLLDLNRVAFILQKRADALIFEKLDAAAREGGEPGLQRALGSVLSLLRRRCALGIADDDVDIEINFGFAGDQPLLFDPGRLFFDEKLQTKEGKRLEMEKATKKLSQWLSDRYPSSAEWLRREIAGNEGVW